jgi:hypothetical protein
MPLSNGAPIYNKPDAEKAGEAGGALKQRRLTRSGGQEALKNRPRFTSR